MSNRAYIADVADVADVAPRALPRRLHLPRLNTASILTYVLLLAGAAVIVLPFLWVVSASFKPEGEILIYPPKLITSALTVEHYDYVLNETRFPTFIKNSLIVAVVTITGHVLSGTLVAYGFARFRFPGRNVLFLLMLGTLMIPFHA